MPDKNRVPNDGAVPSKRKAKRMRSLMSKADAREAKRSTNLTLLRPMSELDKKAVELGIYSEEYHQLPRVKRKKLVSMAYSFHKLSA